jgi:hypothetical protein
MMIGIGSGIGTNASPTAANITGYSTKRVFTEIRQEPCRVRYCFSCHGFSRFCNVFTFFRVDASANRTEPLIDTIICIRCGQTQSLMQMEQPADLAAFQSLRALAIGGE